MGRKEEALTLAKQLRNNLFHNDKDVSNLLLGCKTVCRYLDTLDEYKWIDYELNGYDHLKGRNINEIKNILPRVIFYPLSCLLLLPVIILFLKLV